MNKVRRQGALVGLTVATLLGAATLGTASVVLAASPALAAGGGCNGTSEPSFSISAVSGSGQSTKVGTAFATPLEVQVTESIGTTSCPAAGEQVEFVAPATEPSAVFNGGVTSVYVTTGSDGTATAPTLYADNVTGSYTVSAYVGSSSSTYAPATFQLSNSTVGVPATLTMTSGSGQSATIGGTFAQPLQVTVTDANGDPVAGTTVNFSVVTTAGAGATFAGGGSATTAQTNANGVATSPLLSAGTTAGAFTVTATVEGVTAEATFSLTDLAGAPSTLTAGVGSGQSAELGTDFAVPLAVTVDDADANPLVGEPVTFSAPTHGASGVFAGAGTTAVVLTNSDGVASAPYFCANDHMGGYVVTASVAGVSTPATFALVNTARTAASVTGPDGSYWLVTSTGKVLTSGSAAHLGSTTAKASAPVVGMAAMASGAGYWLVTAKGTVRAFGDAVNYGPAASAPLAKSIVGIAATADGKGYWLVASDGGIFNYGDAVNYGSPASVHLTKPIVGIAATPDGKGYWLVASDGGIFNYGDAAFYGSTGKVHLTKPIVGIAAAPGGKGYWLVASDGGVFAFGHATYYGSGVGLSPPLVKAIVPTADGYGYWIVSANGTAAGFGDAGAQGSATSAKMTIVGGAA
jgi:hypothetical protein